MDRSSLVKMLENYVPVDEIEAVFIEQTRLLLNRHIGDAAFMRSTTEGHITASSFVINPTGEKAAFVHHAKLNRWFQPGGHVEIDIDTNIESACIREAVEETGIGGIKLLYNGIFDIDVHPIPDSPSKGEPAHLHYDIRLLLRAPSEEFAISEESNDIRWLTADELENSPDHNASILRMVGKWRKLALA